MAPIVAAALISGAASIGSSLLNKSGKSSSPSVDYTALINAIKENQGTQERAIQSGYDELQPYLQEYLKNAESTTDQYKADTEALKSKYTTEAQRTEEAQGRLLSDQLKRKTLGSLPELQRSLRKQLAATGGLNRGAASIAMSDLNTKAIQSLAEGQTNLAVQQEQSRAALQQKLLGIDSATLEKVFGVTRDDLMTALNTGRTDVQNKISQMLNSLENTNANIASLTGSQISANYNKALADYTAKAQGNTALTNALSGAIGNVANAWATSKS